MKTHRVPAWARPMVTGGCHRRATARTTLPQPRPNSLVLPSRPPSSPNCERKLLRSGHRRHDGTAYYFPPVAALSRRRLQHAAWACRALAAARSPVLLRRSDYATRASKSFDEMFCGPRRPCRCKGPPLYLHDKLDRFRKLTSL